MSQGASFFFFNIRKHRKTMGRIIEVGLGERSYPIMIERGILRRMGRDLKKRKIAKRYGIIADDRVAALFGERLLDALRAEDLAVELITFAPGEASKNLKTIAGLAGRLASLGFDRADGLIALGGGVAGDMCGFLASIYMRGIPFVQVPTTLLAQVDSSVGGKTGVDIPEGKNLVGTFYQPRCVYIDTAVLESLPAAELVNGLAEVIKYGVIYDSEFFDFLDKNRSRIMDLETEPLTEVIGRSCEIKALVVARDEREGDLRRILNFGHTIGHAVEAASDYSIAHGTAVAIGMVAAATIARRMGLLEASEAERIRRLISDYRMELAVPAHLDRQRIRQYLLTDKKTVGGRIFFVLPTAVGKVTITDQVGEEDIDAALNSVYSFPPVKDS